MEIMVAAVGKYEHLGDNIMKTLVGEIVRSSFPKAHIRVCAKYPDVFRQNPYIDEVFDGSTITSDEGAGRFLSKHRCDLLIDVSGYRDTYFFNAIPTLSGKKPDALVISHQQLRDKLRTIFRIEPPPFTDGEIPIVLSKVDEYTQALASRGFKIERRYFPNIFISREEIKIIANTLLARGFDPSKKTYIVNASASSRLREWGVKNCVNFSRCAVQNGEQTIITGIGKEIEHAFNDCLEGEIRRKDVFYIRATTRQFFSHLGINSYFQKMVVLGVVSSDTGAMHAAQAVSNVLPRHLRPVNICLGHNQTSGDIRYAQPGSIYIARLKSEWLRELENAATRKLSIPWQHKLSVILTMPYTLISIDCARGESYLIRPIPQDQNLIPVFNGKQIYTHTLLRDILSNSKKPLSGKRRSEIYRRDSVKKIEPAIVYGLVRGKTLLK